MTQNSIFKCFPISGEEYGRLDEKFGSLCQYISWQLLKKNSKNSHTDDFFDIDQTLRTALIQAGAYYKRQIYTEHCLNIVKQFIKDNLIKALIDELDFLWRNRTRHGANRQKYGPFQENLLEKLVHKYVPRNKRPRKDAPLVIDSKFPTYCKQIIWNMQKTLGKRITREKSIRTGLTSLSEYENLASG